MTGAMHRRALCSATLLVSLALVGCKSSASVLPADDASSAEQGDDDASGGSSSGTSPSGSNGGSSSSSGGTHAGSGSGSGGSVSGGSASGSSSGSSSGRVTSNIVFTDAGVPLCGSNTPCDLSKNICCVSDTAQGAEGSCIAQTSSCTSDQASFACLQESDCPSGKVCCGFANNSAGLASAGSTCQTGDPCTPIPDGGAQSTVGSAQLCQTDAECKNSMHCIWQVCTIHTTVDTLPVTIYPNLTMCGLQTVAPYDCSECPGAANCAPQAQ